MKFRIYINIFVLRFYDRYIDNGEYFYLFVFFWKLRF